MIAVQVDDGRLAALPVKINGPHAEFTMPDKTRVAVLFEDGAFKFLPIRSSGQRRLLNLLGVSWT